MAKWLDRSARELHRLAPRLVAFECSPAAPGWVNKAADGIGGRFDSMIGESMNWAYAIRRFANPPPRAAVPQYMQNQKTHFSSVLFTLLMCCSLFNITPVTTAWAETARPITFTADGQTVRLVGLNSRYYRIWSELPPDQANRIGRHMDAVYAEYQRRFASFPSRSDEPMNLYLLRTREHYLAFMQRFGLDASPTAGIFFVQRQGRGLATWVQGRNRSTTYQTLQHEGFHQFAYNHIGTNIPIWLNEGLAQYFEDGIIVGGSNGTMRLGFANADRLRGARAALDEGTSMPLGELVRLTDEQWNRFLHTDPVKAARLYDQAWSLVFFITQAGGKYLDAMQDMLKAIAAGKPREQSIEPWFKRIDLRVLQRDWESFIRNTEPDPLSTAVSRLEFLGDAMDFLRSRNDPVPDSITALRRSLQRIGFRATRTRNGVTSEFDSRIETFYQYGHPGPVRGSFEFMKPDKPDLPWRITAPRLKPQPTLVWYRDDEGELVADIVYQP